MAANFAKRPACCVLKSPPKVDDLLASRWFAVAAVTPIAGTDKENGNWLNNGGWHNI